MIEILNPTALPRAREAGALVADILQTLKSRSTVGTNLLDIDRWAEAMIVEAGAQSCYVDYAPSFGRGPFGHYICTSVNDAVLHGLPHDYTLADGDLLSLDLAVSQGGVVADSAISFVVGDTQAAGERRDDRARPSAHWPRGSPPPAPELASATSPTPSARSSARRGIPINTEFGGHGVGSTMHQDPHVSNTGRPGRGYRLRPGLLLALEPWVMADTAELVTDADGWTLRSATGCRTAHSEHTIAITDDGAEILTLPRERT